MANTTKITLSAAELKTALAAKQTELDAAKNALQDALSCDPIDMKLLKECREKAATACEEWNDLNVQMIYAGCYENRKPDAGRLQVWRCDEEEHRREREGQRNCDCRCQ